MSAPATNPTGQQTDTERERSWAEDDRTVAQETLIQGRRMICPRCERAHDILAYVPMQIVEKFAAETNPIYKCPSCRWIFSPGARFLGDPV